MTDEQKLHLHPNELCFIKGITPEVLFVKVLDAVQNGISPADIYKNPQKYLTSGKIKEIIINLGGEGIKVSPEIIQEMAKRGDDTAITIIKEDLFQTYNAYNFKLEPLKFAFLEKKGVDDRENKILIEIIKEGKMKNNGGMHLAVCSVHEESYSYKIIHEKDLWKSESIKGWHKIVATMKG